MLKVSMTIRNWNLDSKPHLFDLFFSTCRGHTFSLCSPQSANWVAESVNLDDGTRSSENHVASFATSSEPGGFLLHICFLSRLLFRPGAAESLPSSMEEFVNWNLDRAFAVAADIRSHERYVGGYPSGLEYTHTMSSNLMSIPVACGPRSNASRRRHDHLDGFGDDLG